MLNKKSGWITIYRLLFCVFQQANAKVVHPVNVASWVTFLINNFGSNVMGKFSEINGDIKHYAENLNEASFSVVHFP